MRVERIGRSRLGKGEMADTVQELLEDMVPELEDLARKRIFSDKEIKEIVKKRRDFEYKLKRRESQKSEYLRYIAYETTLDKLRNLRKKRLGYGKKSKSSVSDFSMQKRLHFIFDRMLRKWKGDVALWTQYIDFCVDQSANKMLHSVLARALQYHPRDVSLWIRAATWHFDSQGDVKAARIMCQRGLRMIDDSVELWCHYLRLELCYIDKVRQRQRMLGIEGDMPAREELEAALESKKRKRDDSSDQPADGEDRDMEAGGDTQADADRSEEQAATASGARALAAATLRIASVITDNARKTVPKSLPLLLGLASVCVEFPHTELLEDKLFAEIAENFPGSREGWAASAARAKVRTDRLRKQGRPVTLAEVDAGSASAAAVFRQAVANPAYAKEPALWEAYVAHAKATLAAASASTEAARTAESELRAVCVPAPKVSVRLPFIFQSCDTRTHWLEQFSIGILHCLNADQGSCFPEQVRGNAGRHGTRCKLSGGAVERVCHGPGFHGRSSASHGRGQGRLHTACCEFAATWTAGAAVPSP